MARLEEIGSTNLPLSIGGTPDGNQRDGNLRNTVDKLLGNEIMLNTTRSVGACTAPAIRDPAWDLA